MAHLIFILLLVSTFPVRADHFNDEEIEQIETTLKEGVEKYFSKTNLYAGPRGLLLLENCEKVKFEEFHAGQLPTENQETFSVEAELTFKRGQKRDTLNSKVQIKRLNGSFNVAAIEFPEDQLTSKDRCAPLRKNPRLLASVRKREILKGMSETAVLASWGDPLKREVQKDGSVVLIYPSKRVSLLGGAVHNWQLD